MAKVPIVSLNQEQSTLVPEVMNALQTFGFMCVSDHGLNEDIINRAFQSSKSFFNLPTDVKNAYALGKIDGPYRGYAGLELESLDPLKPADLKESFSFIPSSQALEWPDRYVPNFAIDMMTMLQNTAELGCQILSLIGEGLVLQCKNYLRECHSYMDFTKNQTALRTLHYPPAGQNRVFQPGQLHCGEHADYGSLTLLFQDSPGLEIMTEAGKWIPVPPVAGTVVINIGDMLQRWSSDRLPSTRHRVTFGGKDEKSVPRQSLALFMNPDTDTVIRCLDGSDKYQPVTMKEYLAMKHKAAYCSD